MKPRTVITIVLLVFVAASVVVLVAKEFRGRDAPHEPAPPDGVVVTYFHRNKRCDTCTRIETYAREAVQAAFAADLDDGRVTFRTVNLDTPGSEHYVDQYQLFANAVVLAEFRGGIQARWKNLAEVWDRTGDRADFVGYVQRELADFMRAD